jgi:hypothetical protein
VTPDGVRPTIPSQQSGQGCAIIALRNYWKGDRVVGGA